MATSTVKYIKSAAPPATVSGQPTTDVAALVLAYNRLEARFEALLTKLDNDPTIAATDWMSAINAAEPNALITLAAVQ